MKSYWKPLLTGIIVAALLVLVMLKVTMNFQVLLFLGTTLFFAAGLLHARKDTHYLATALAVSVFYVVFFALIGFPELMGEFQALDDYPLGEKGKTGWCGIHDAGCGYAFYIFCYDSPGPGTHAGERTE